MPSLLVSSLLWLASPAAAQDSAGPAGVVVDKVAAVVNDRVITLSDVYTFREYIDQQVAAGEPRLAAELAVVELLLERALIEEEVLRLHLDPTDQDLERTIEDIARSNGMDPAAMRAEVERQGMAWDAYRAELRENLRERNFGQYVLRPRISTIGDDELRDRFRRSTPAQAESARVLAIFLPWPGDDAGKAALRAQAAELQAQAAGGADFAALAAAHDKAGFSARGGEMGRFRPGELMPALDLVVTGTPTGAVAPVVETEQGLFILKVADRASDDGFEAARESLMNEIFQERLVEEQQRWFEQARRGASVRVLLGPAQ